MRRTSSATAVIAALALATASCGESDDSPSTDDPFATASTTTAAPIEATQPCDPEDFSCDPTELFPDVLDATATLDGDTWTVSATLSSPYDSPERYADAWRVIGPDGTVYAERILTHDHASEQPFTRSESGIEIPDDVTEVTIEGRDQISGYGGETFDLTLPR